MSSTSSGPAFVPKASMAFSLAAATSSVFAISSRTFANSSFAFFPSFPQFATAFFSPANTVSVFTPSFSNFASIATDSSVEKPSCRSAAPFFVTCSVREDTFTPVVCPAFARTSRIFVYSLASMPPFSMALDTRRTASVASVPVISANFKKFSVASSNSFPVNPNLVFTSPRAEPMSPMSPTTLWATLL